jgi:hypothetical protein
LTRKSRSSNSSSVFNVATIIFKGNRTVIETDIGTTFTVTSHHGLSNTYPKTLTLTEIRADDEDADCLRLSLSVKGKTFPLTLISMAEPNRKTRPSSMPGRPVAIKHNPDMISDGPDW